MKTLVAAALLVVPAIPTQQRKVPPKPPVEQEQPRAKPEAEKPANGSRHATGVHPGFALPRGRGRVFRADSFLISPTVYYASHVAKVPAANAELTRAASAVQQAQQAKSHEAALTAIRDAQRALLRARAALWEHERSKEGKPRPARQ